MGPSWAATPRWTPTTARPSIRDQIEVILAQARKVDADEDAQPELLGTDELPVELSTASGRLARLQAAQAHIEAHDAAAAAEAAQRAANAQAAAAQGNKLRGHKPKEPHAALARAQADEQAVRARTAAKARARPDQPTSSDQATAAIDRAVEADRDVQAAVATTAAAEAVAATQLPRRPRPTPPTLTAGS